MSKPGAPDASAPQRPSGGTGPNGPAREVHPALRLVGFAVVLSAVFGGALLLGDRWGPVAAPVAAEAAGSHAGGADGSGHGDGHGPSPAEAGGGLAAAPAGGLRASEAGYTLELITPVLPAGHQDVEFRILGPDGSAVTDYEVEHEKELHLIAVRRDFTGYQHVHPERADDGTWVARLLLTGGTWRVFADFTPSPMGVADPLPLTLGADVTVPGSAGKPSGTSGSTRRVDTVDGYRVELTGGLRAGGESRLRFAVSRDGRAVSELQPYLGARGHLVALREGDLAYLHVHPVGDPAAAGNAVGFAATAPSAGGYRLYFDFRIDGVVRTASFALVAENSSAEASREGSGVDHGDSRPVGEHAH